ncbi:MAG: energy transducer TonB, partial [Planctomycetota bacterium]
YRPVPQLASPPALPVPPPPSAASAVVDAKPDADNPPPEYPADDRIRGHEGTVVVAVDLDARGVVLVAALATPSPFPGLNRAALRAVRAWRFEPARAHGVAVPGRLEIPIVFRLTDG